MGSELLDLSGNCLLMRPENVLSKRLRQLAQSTLMMAFHASQCLSTCVTDRCWVGPRTRRSAVVFGVGVPSKGSWMMQTVSMWWSWPAPIHEVSDLDLRWDELGLCSADVRLT